MFSAFIEKSNTKYQITIIIYDIIGVHIMWQLKYTPKNAYI